MEALKVSLLLPGGEDLNKQNRSKEHFKPNNRIWNPHGDLMAAENLDCQYRETNITNKFVSKIEA